MAGLGGLPYFIQYSGELQQQAAAKQKQQQDMLVFQQQQQDRQRQQAALAAAGNALPQLIQQPPMQQQPAPQPPAPGQASQPMQQPQGGGVPLPQGPVPGQVVRPPLPPGGVQGAMPPQGVPPFRPMPTTPPQSQAAPQGAIPVPPQPQQAPQPTGGLTLQRAIEALKSQGLEGADLMAGLGQLMPVLDAQSKQQAAQLQSQFNNELKVANLTTARESLQARIDAAKQASEDRRLGIAEREQAHRDSLGMQQELLQFRIEEAKAKHAGDPDAKLDPETVKILAEQAYSGDTSVYQNLGRGVQGAQNIVAIRKEVAKMRAEKGETGAEQAASNVAFQGEKAAARTTAVASGKQAQAADEASQLADQALTINSQFERGNYPDINAALTDLQRRGGNTQVGQFKVAINGFKNTYSRAISPTGTPTVHDKQHADELFDLNQSPAQFSANIAQAKKEMAAAIAAPGHVQAKQRARITGREQPATQAEPTKTIGNKTYVQRNGTWYEQ